MNTDLRALFPGARRRVYLDVAAKGLVPTTVRAQVHAYLDDQVDGTVDKGRLRRTVEHTRTRIAALIGADADEVAVTKNVSEGVNLFAASLPWASGDNVVICPDVEHLPLPIHLARYGVDLDAPETAHSDGPLRYRSGALRFDLGDYN